MRLRAVLFLAALRCLAPFALIAVVAGCGRTRVAVENDASVPDGDASSRVCRIDPDCNDGIFCNGIERCIDRRCVAGPVPSCDDGVDCTIDRCPPGGDVCRHIPDPSRCSEGEICHPVTGCTMRECRFDSDCDDGLVCNGTEFCVKDRCVATMPPACDDGRECTDDVCEEAEGGCISRPRDRDGDGFGDAACDGDDCNDENPWISPGAPEDCENGLDDDCNARIDCDDPACATRPGCTCLPSEDCASGGDRDCDGRVGCDDPDCSGLPVCMTPCVTRDLGSAVGGAVATGDTVGSPNVVTPSCAESNAPEHIFRWTAPASGAWIFDTIGSRFDTMLVVLRSCSGPELACNDDTAGFGTASRVTVRLMAGETVLIVVDGWAMSAGRYQLNIQMGGGMEVCDNGTDDDGDGLVDCADVDCATAPSCCRPRPEVCTNGVDDDCDRLVDCADPDCRRSPSCCVPSPEVCTDGRDQDCDRLVD
jgi:hypothetical protein